MNWVTFERNTSWNLCLRGGDRLWWLYIGPFSWVEVTLVSLKRNPLVLEAAECSKSFRYEKWVSFEEIASWNFVFSRWRYVPFFPNRPIQLSWKNTWISQRKPIVLEAGASRTFCCVRLALVWERNTSCNLDFSRSRRAYLLPNCPVQLSWRNTCIFLRKTSMLETSASSTLFHCNSWVSFWKEYFLQLRFWRRR